MIDRVCDQMMRYLIIAWLFTAVVGIGDPRSHAVADESVAPIESTEVVTDVATLKSLSQQSSKPIRFAIQGRLIWWNSDGYVRLEIGVSSRSFMFNSADNSLIEFMQKRSVGDLIEVRGFDQPGPAMNSESLHLVKEGEQTDLIKVAAFRNSRPKLWRYVEHLGFVREILELKDGFRLLLGNNDVVVMCDQSVSHERLEKWFGEIVQVEGAALRWPRPSDRLSSITHIGVLEPLGQIKHLYNEDQPQTAEGTSGSQSEEEDNETLELKDAVVEHVGANFFFAGGHKISTALAPHIKLGSVVQIQAERNPKKDDCFRAVWVTETNHVSPPSSSVKTAQQIIDGNYLNRRVSLTGTVDHSFANDRSVELHLKSKGNRVIVRMPVPHERRQIDQYVRHSIVKASGIVREIESTENGNLIEMIVSGTKDLTVLDAPLQVPSNQLQWLAWLAAGLVGLILLAWYVALKRQVKNKTRELSNSTNQIIAASEAVRDGLVIFDAMSNVRLTNDKVTQSLGVNIPQGIPHAEACILIQSAFRDVDEFASLWRETFAVPQATFEREFALKNSGSVYVFSAPILDQEKQPAGRVWTFEDTTQRRKLEEEALQSRKLSAVGRLAGGVAHDFNNLLHVIGTNVALLAHASSEAGIENQQQPLEEVSAAVNRGADLTRQLLTFARTSDVQCVPTDVNEIVQRTASILRRTIGEHIQLSISMAKEMSRAQIDPGQLEQVLINLCLNSRDAIGHNTGCIQISTRQDVNQQSEPAVVIAIRDDGCGMPGHVVEKIFEPFFSTKTLDKGNGLGLATSRGAIEQMGGQVECTSVVGEGTTFRIVLPCAEQVSAKVPSPKMKDFQPRLRELDVLVVDDNDAVRRSLQLLLSTEGHRVVTASGGRKALDILEDESFDVVLLDLSMPEMSGWQVLEVIQERHPNQKVILCSGYSSEAEKMISSGLKPDGYLDKPFRLEGLNRALDQLGLFSPSASTQQNKNESS
jgi:signal transduction histidine kinase/ActR/RegA family two-component response regulator